MSIPTLCNYGITSHMVEGVGGKKKNYFYVSETGERLARSELMFEKWKRNGWMVR